MWDTALNRYYSGLEKKSSIGLFSYISQAVFYLLLLVEEQ